MDGCILDRSRGVGAQHADRQCGGDGFQERHVGGGHELVLAADGELQEGLVDLVQVAADNVKEDPASFHFEQSECISGFFDVFTA